VEKGEGDEIRAKLDAVIWRSDLERIAALLARSGQSLAEEVAIRCRAQVDFYPPGGRLQLVVREVDPVFTLGLLAERRRETLRALAAAGLLDRNRELPLSPLPLRVALVTSAGSAAYHDFLHTLGESGFPFRVLLLHSPVQGREAERGIAGALSLLDPSRVDCAALVRGGGSKSDLAVFDSRLIAEAVARAPVPVLTGLGHQIDESIADRVAHTALKTPTKVAELLVERAREAERTVNTLARELAVASRGRLAAAREALSTAGRGVELARFRCAAVARRLAELARALAVSARTRLGVEVRRNRELGKRAGEAAVRGLRRASLAPPVLARHLVALARGRLREGWATLDGLDRLTRGLSPQRTLDRGYSITRNAAGAVLRAADQAAPGSRIHTRLAHGELMSEVVPRAPSEAPSKEPR
jgi:exodeoxyribonuclease VII large subunit